MNTTVICFYIISLLVSIVQLAQIDQVDLDDYVLVFESERRNDEVDSFAQSIEDDVKDDTDYDNDDANNNNDTVAININDHDTSDSGIIEIDTSQLKFDPSHPRLKLTSNTATLLCRDLRIHPSYIEHIINLRKTQTGRK